MSSPINCVVVGDMFSGKTSLISAMAAKRDSGMHFLKKPFNSTTINVEGKSMEFRDTQSQDDAIKTRSKYYQEANVFLICFELVMSISGRIDDVHDKWYREIRHHSQAPIILVGTHKDLRDKNNRLDANPNQIISYVRGDSLGTKIKAVKYLECSPKTGDGIDAVAEEAAKAGSTFKPEVKPVKTLGKPVKFSPRKIRFRI